MQILYCMYIYILFLFRKVLRYPFRPAFTNLQHFPYIFNSRFGISVSFRYFGFVSVNLGTAFCQHIPTHAYTVSAHPPTSPHTHTDPTWGLYDIWPRIYKKNCPCSTQPSMKFVLLINHKLLTIANSFFAKHSQARKFLC